ncbi:MAG TPA: glycosyltransferase [Solirubrobacterales bacterium]|nr:glycosyltransferase [Solirubrobacterales bacterium]
MTVDILYVRGFQSKLAYVRGLEAIPRRLRRGSYNLLHVHYGHTLASSLLVNNTPIVASFCGEDLLGAPRGDTITAKSRVEVAVFRRLAPSATRTITKSSEMEDVLPAPLRARNSIVPNGVDLERFQWRDTSAARRQLGWDPHGKVILFLGNPDDPRKNFTLARAAAAWVGARKPDTRLEVVWELPVALVPTAMNAADILAFPSRSEGSPNAVKEAMASELPIVATPVGDVPERLIGVDGCQVVEGGPEAFGEALLDGLSYKRAPAARAAISPLSTQRVAEQIAAIYHDAIDAYTS